MTIPPDEEKFFRILHPYAFDHLNEAQSKGTRFVHYTTAEAAMSILRDKEIWMRDSSCMNDFSEVWYGLNLLHSAYYNSQAGKDFQQALDEAFTGLSKETADLFFQWAPYFQFETYLTCISEHENDEDTFGRLSMWRSYSGRTGVALVIKNDIFFTPSPGFHPATSPVAYLSKEGF